MKKLFLCSLFVLAASLTNVWAQETGVNQYAFSANGKMLAVADFTGDVNIWDLTTGSEIQTLSPKTNEIGSLDFSADGKILAINDNDHKRILFYETATGRETKRLGFRNIANYQNLSLMSADSQTYWLINVNSNEPSEAWQFDLKNNSLKAGKPLLGWAWTFDRANDLLAFYSKEDEKIVLISANTGKEIRRLPIDGTFMDKYNRLSMNFSAAGDKLFLYRKNSETDKENQFNHNYFHEIAVISTADGKELKRRTLPVYKDEENTFENEPGIIVSPDSSKIFLLEDANGFGDKPKHLTTIDANTLESVGDVYYPNEKYDWSTVSPDGKTILTADKTGKIILWSTTTEKQTGKLFPAQSAFEHVAVSADDSKYAAIAGNGTIKIWNSNGALIRKIETELPKGEMLAFSPNGQIILSVHSTTLPTEIGEDTTNLVRFKLWNVADGKLVREFNNHFYPSIAPIHFIVFNHQGDRLIADCGETKKIDLCVWNVNTGEFSGRSFPETDGETISIFKISDNQPLLFNSPVETTFVQTEDYDKKYLVWDLATEKLLAQTKETSEAAQAVGDNQNATVILLKSANDENKGFAVFRLDGKTNLGEQFETYISDYVHPDFAYAAKFAAAEKPAQNPTEFVGKEIPMKPDNFETPAIYLDTADELINEVKIYKTDTTETVARLKGHTDDLIDLAFTRNTNRVVTISYDRTARVWDLLTGKQLFTLK